MYLERVGDFPLLETATIRGERSKIEVIVNEHLSNSSTTLTGILYFIACSER